MTRGTKAIVAALVVLAALVGAVGHVGVVGHADASTDDSASTAALAASPATAATAAQEDCSFPATLTDASGTEVTLEESPEDIVALGQSTAQTVWELGEQEHVVGMPGSNTAYLNGSSNRTHVLDGTSVQIETVVDLEPDLVIAADIIQPDDVQALRDAGLTVYRESPASSLDAVRERTETTGQLLGACGAANETVTWMNERLSVVDEAVEGEDRPSVLVQGSYVPGSGTFQGDLIARAGGDNAAANMGIEGWDQFEVEAAIEENPDYFLVTGDASVSEDSPLQQTTAGQEDNYVRVDTNYWNQPAPRVVIALESIAEQLHPEAYENATEAPGENGTDSGDGTGANGNESAADDGEDDGTGDGSPGFGVPVAVAALIGSLLALRRRT